MFPDLIDTPQHLRRLAEEQGTPLWVYKADIIAERVAQLRQFDVIRFAQKACSNIHILSFLRQHGVLVDAVSCGEIERAVAAGYASGAAQHGQIVFTCDVFDRHSLARVVELEIDVNAGSIDMLEQLGAVSPGHRVWLRVNPGFGHGHSAKTNTGGENSKHGIWHEDVPLALAMIRNHGLKLVGLHMHIGSGVDYGHLAQVCGAMVELVRRLDVNIDAISAGGGLAIPYRPGDASVDTGHYFELWNQARRDIEGHLGHPIGLEIEPGRFLVAESGVLISEVRATKSMGSKHYVLTDAGFNDLMRPAMYGSFHGISVIDAEGTLKTDVAAKPSIVAGPLCESGDVFTLGDEGVVAPIALPAAQVGDMLVFHDAGAYGASMSSGYNTRPLAAEMLIEGDASRLIRRRQTVAEMIDLERVG
ncbi:MAG: diaminopimelate decarboxylase [Pseudomonadota bacterium]